MIVYDRIRPVYYRIRPIFFCPIPIVDDPYPSKNTPKSYTYRIRSYTTIWTIFWAYTGRRLRRRSVYGSSTTTMLRIRSYTIVYWPYMVVYEKYDIEDNHKRSYMPEYDFKIVGQTLVVDDSYPVLKSSTKGRRKVYYRIRSSINQYGELPNRQLWVNTLI